MKFGKTPFCLFLSLLLQHRGVGEDFAFAAADQVRRLEIDYRKAKDVFDQDTRVELTRIARDKSLVGEAKILAIQQWFSSQAGQIEAINQAAGQLDKLDPISRQSPSPPLATEDTPEARNALQLKAISRRYAKGEIDLEEFDRLRAPLMAEIPADKATRVSSPLPKPSLPASLDDRVSKGDLASLLTAQARYLASLPAESAFAELSNPESPINRLRTLLQIKKQIQQP